MEKEEEGGEREEERKGGPGSVSYEVSTSHCQGQMIPSPHPTPLLREPSLRKGTQVGCGAGKLLVQLLPGPQPWQLPPSTAVPPPVWLP